MSSSGTPLVKACLRLLGLCGVFAFRNNVGAVKIGNRFVRFGEPGSSDIFAVHAGRFIAIEAKMGSGRLSPAQKLWLQRAAAAGAICLVIRNVDELANWLRDQGLLA